MCVLLFVHVLVVLLLFIALFVYVFVRLDFLSICIYNRKQSNQHRTNNTRFE